MKVLIHKPWGSIYTLTDVVLIERNVIHPSLGIKCSAIVTNPGQVHYVDERMNTLDVMEDQHNANV